MSVEFEEDKKVLRPWESADQVPESGFEGWFHRHLPYGPKTNRTILIIIALVILIIAAFFFFAAVHNFDQVDSRNSNFQERVNNTRGK